MKDNIKAPSFNRGSLNPAPVARRRRSWHPVANLFRCTNRQDLHLGTLSLATASVQSQLQQIAKQRPCSGHKLFLTSPYFEIFS